VCGVHRVIQDCDGGFDVANPEVSGLRVARPTFTTPFHGYHFGADHRWLQGGACSSMQAALLNGEGGWDVVGAGERWKTDLEVHEAVTKVRFR
jgi:hypothetical protein